MSSPPRRSGFRLPWSGQDHHDEKTDGSAAAGTETADAAVTEQEAAPESQAAADARTTPDATDAVAADEPESTEPETAEQPETSAESEAATEPEPTKAQETEPEAAPADKAAAPDEAPKEAEPEPPRDMLRELVTAMRRVADEAREVDLRDLGPRVDDRLARFRTEAEERAAELQQRADADVAGIGEWARTETERIKAEAEARVAARRQELDAQLAAAERQADDGTEEVRRRVAEYERSLAAFFTQLGDITDPAAFAAAAKEMPRPPEIEEIAGADADADTAGNGASAETSNTEANGAALTAGATHGTSGSTVVVKGLSSFGSITAFKQSLEAVEGVSEVTLSLGPTGEFVYRAVHSEGFDLQGAIAAMERGAAAVERQTDGTLQVTVGRGR